VAVVALLGATPGLASLTTPATTTGTSAHTAALAPAQPPSYPETRIRASTPPAAPRDPVEAAPSHFLRLGYEQPRAAEVVGSLDAPKRAGGDLPYNPRVIESELETLYPGQVRSGTIAPNPTGRVVHPGTNILIDERGFPVYDDVARFDTRLSDSIASVPSRRLHGQEATRALNDAILKGQVRAGQFSPQQMAAIEAGSERIPGFTWHHHQQFGRMQLVPSTIHRAVGHVGGFKFWY